MKAAVWNWASEVREAAFGGRRLRPHARIRPCSVLAAALTLTVSSPTIGLGAEKTGPAQGTSDLEVAIRVYNYSEASHGTLEGAERAASRIYGKTGVTTTWLDCREPVVDLQPTTDTRCGGPVNAATLVLRILPGSAPAGGAFNNTVSGYATGSFLATVFYGRVVDLAYGLDGDQRETPAVLGYVIAHELGHLLLGTNSHSPGGIMSGRWDRAYLRLAKEGFQTFSPEQSALMRAAVLRRHEGATLQW